VPARQEEQVRRLATAALGGGEDKTMLVMAALQVNHVHVTVASEAAIEAQKCSTHGLRRGSHVHGQGAAPRWLSSSTSAAFTKVIVDWARLASPVTPAQRPCGS
jgi:hypothetical protein